MYISFSLDTTSAGAHTVEVSPSFLRTTEELPCCTDKLVCTEKDKDVASVCFAVRSSVSVLLLFVFFMSVVSECLVNVSVFLYMLFLYHNLTLTEQQCLSMFVVDVIVIQFCMPLVWM